MTTRDIHNTLFPIIGLVFALINSDTTTVGIIIDTAESPGYNSLEFLFLSATITDGTYTPLIEHGDDPALSDAAPVPDNQLVGTEAAAAFVAADDDKVKRIGYVGNKRFVRASLVSIGTTAGGNLGAIAQRGHARNNPVPGNS